MSQQQIQFPNEAPIAARKDPWTSHAAGNEITASGKRDLQKSVVLEALRAWGVSCTSAELANHAGLCRFMCARRLPDLEKDGHVIREGTMLCGITGRYGVAWRVA